MAAEARFNRLSVATENWTLLAQYPDLADIWQKEEHHEDLTSNELARWEAWSMRVLTTREWSFRELPRSELLIENWRRNYENWPTFRAFYQREKGRFDPEFVKWHDENISRD